MEEKVNALMLRSVDYADNDKILTLFSLEQGVISAKMRGVKKAGAKLKFAAEPFCFAEYILTGGNMKTVTNASLTDSFYPLRENIFRFYAASAATEFVLKFCPENAVSSGLFFETVRFLKNCAYTDVPTDALLLIFLLHALKEIGYSLRFGDCAGCGEPLGRVFFDFSTGSGYCENCRTENAVEVSPVTYELLNKISAFQLGTVREKDIAELGVADNYFVRALRLTAKYLRSVAKDEPKSLKEFLKMCEF